MSYVDHWIVTGMRVPCIAAGLPDSLVLLTVGDTPPQRRVAVVDTGYTVGVVRAPAPPLLLTLPMARHTSSI